MCVHPYPVSTKMTCVLNVQSLKLKLPPSLPLSAIRLPQAPDREANTPPPPSHLIGGRETGTEKKMSEQQRQEVQR